jgi:hypothetical protein
MICFGSETQNKFVAFIRQRQGAGISAAEMKIESKDNGR